MSFPILAFSLADKEQLRLGENIRIFLVQEADAEGVGLEWTRPSRQQADCTWTTVNYFLWEGRGENTRYCQCFDGRTGQPLPPAAATCK